MAEYPDRGSTPWDDTLKAYIDEKVMFLDDLYSQPDVWQFSGPDPVSGPHVTIGDVDPYEGPYLSDIESVSEVSFDIETYVYSETETGQSYVARVAGLLEIVPTNIRLLIEDETEAALDGSEHISYRLSVGAWTNEWTVTGSALSTAVQDDNVPLEGVDPLVLLVPVAVGDIIIGEGWCAERDVVGGWLIADFSVRYLMHVNPQE